MKKSKIQYADDDRSSVRKLLLLRFPSVIIGLFLGILLSFATSRFEEVLVKDIRLAFFIPFIVYMADAVGTQTQNIYARDLRTGKASFKKYLFKEMLIGLMFGLISSLLSSLVIMLWFGSTELMLVVSLAVFGAIAIAPLVALLVTEIFQLEREDPAVGAGPIATVIQDTLSVLIYGFIASAIIS